MRAIIQRVKEAKVKINTETVAQIERGILLLLGIGKQDNQEAALNLVKKIVKLRIFEDAQGKMNLSLKEVNGEVLVISQFTLYADCGHGRRPSFDNACEPRRAEGLYNLFISELGNTGIKVKEGRFAAKMEVSLINDGPATFILEDI